MSYNDNLEAINMAWNIANKLQAIYDTLTMVVKESFDEGDLSVLLWNSIQKNQGKMDLW